MENFNKIEEEVEKTLSSLDGIKSAEANPYLYSRVASRMQTASGMRKHILGFVISAILILIINIVTLISYNKGGINSNTDKNTYSRQEKLNIIISDYNLNDFYNNIDY